MVRIQAVLLLVITSLVTGDPHYHTRLPRNICGMFYCMDRDWHGPCMHEMSSTDTCVTLRGMWNHSISSFGPDDGSYCTFFSDDGCRFAVWDRQHDKQFELSYPGSTDLSELGVEDSFGSYVCSKPADCES